MNNIPEATPPKRVRPHYKALYEESQKENDELKEEAEENKKLFDTTFSEYMKLKAQIEKLREELLETKFDAWRELQQEIHPQYSIDEEIGCLLSASDDTKLIKKIFDELYYGEYVYVIETEKYREWEDEDDE